MYGDAGGGICRWAVRIMSSAENNFPVGCGA